MRTQEPEDAAVEAGQEAHESRAADNVAATAAAEEEVDQEVPSQNLARQRNRKSSDEAVRREMETQTSLLLLRRSSAVEV